MKQFAKTMHALRNTLLTEKINRALLDFKYSRNTRCGIFRGYMSILMGRVEFQDEYRPLILGKNIDFHMEHGSSIILTGKNKISEGEYPANNIHPAATSIGTFPHWNFMNPSIGRPTRRKKHYTNNKKNT